MGAIEIFLVIAGVILVAVTYILSEKFDSGNSEIGSELGDNVKKITEQLVREEVKSELSLSIDEKVESTLIELDKLANEKIMAVGSYSDEILDKINKNHDEVMFLYNMLNEKEETLKNTIRDIEALKLSVKKMSAEMPDLKNDTASVKMKEKVKNEPEKAAKKSDNKIQNLNMTDSAANKNEMILRMYEEGNTDIEIAKKLGIGMGEVRLVIDLFKKDN